MAKKAPKRLTMKAAWAGLIVVTGTIASCTAKILLP